MERPARSASCVGCPRWRWTEPHTEGAGRVDHVPLDVRVLAIDVHKNTISAAVLEPGSMVPVVDKISADDESVRRLVARFEEPGRVWACYEAGPTGYELARVLRGAGMRCEVIAPSLIPARPGDRVKTDKRDARRLALLFRGNQLSSVRVPTPAEEDRVPRCGVGRCRRWARRRSVWSMR